MLASRLMFVGRFLFYSKPFRGHLQKKIKLKTNGYLHVFDQSFHNTGYYCYPKVVPFILPDIGEGIVEVVVKEWYVKTGDNISQFDPLCEVQSDKASVTITSRYDGKVTNLHYKEEDIAKVGLPLIDITVSGESDQAEDKTPIAKRDVETENREFDTIDEILKDKALATPAVRKMAKEEKINLKDVVPTGKGGRVLKEDILNYLKKKVVNTNESFTKQKIAGIQKVMVKSMTKAWEIPHFTYSDEVDVSNMVALKPQINNMGREVGIKLTYLPLFLKAISLSLLKYPQLNANFDFNSDELVINNRHNLGIAIDTPSGLLVPNVKDVQNRTIVEIGTELQRLQKLGLQNKLSPEDFSAGTFTLSNIGAIGGTSASPVIMAPQVAIGALGRIQKLPRYSEKGDIQPLDILTVSWSADHRVIDGATIARFSNLFKLYIGNPKLLLHL